MRPIPKVKSDIVVVVDDDVVAADSLCLLLESYGFSTVAAYDGCEARNLVERLEPAVLVSDIEMPHMSGIQLARALKARPTAGSPALIALTGSSGIRDEALSAGFDYFLMKPAVVTELVRMLRQLLHRLSRVSSR